MTWNPAQVALRTAEGGEPQDGAAVVLQPPGALQHSDAVELIERAGGEPQPGGAVVLQPGAGGGGSVDEPDEPEPTDPYPPFRGPALGVSTPYGAAHARAHGTRAAWADLPQRQASNDAAWSESERQPRLYGFPWGTLHRRRAEHAAPWPNTLEPARTQVAAPWIARMRRPRPLTGAPFGDQPHRLRPLLRLAYFHPPASRPGIRAPSGELDRRHGEELALPWNHPPRRQGHWRIPWGTAHRPPWAFHPPPPDEPEPPEPEPPYTPPPGDAVHLDLHCPLTGSTDLWIGYDCPPIETGRTIMVDNQITVERDDDGKKIAVDRVQISTDIDSWTWDWRGRILGKPSLQKIEHGAEGPRALRVTINGLEWIVLAEEYSEDRTWRETQRDARGRGRAAFLAGPYAPGESGTESGDRTAQQLAADALEFTNWTVQWEIPDWLIPGGVYTYQGQTPMERITRLAEAAGAVVLSHPSDRTLIVRSRYPTSPWQWDSATPDVTIQASQIRSAASRWEPEQRHNRIHIAGREEGVLVRVTRQGSAGDLPADNIVDELITHVDAGRERGRVELSRAGDAAAITLELPFLTGAQQPGLLQPGQLLEVEDKNETWRGLVTGVQVDATRQSVSQSVEVERRFAE